MEYNNRKVYECFNNPFTYDFGSPSLNLRYITIDDRPPPPHKKACYTTDLLPAAISVASENSVSPLSTYYDLPDLLPTDDPNPLHVIKKDVHFLGMVYKDTVVRNMIKICYKNTRFYCSTCSDKKKKLYYCHMFSRIIS